MNASSMTIRERGFQPNYYLKISHVSFFFEKTLNSFVFGGNMFWYIWVSVCRSLFPSSHKGYSLKPHVMLRCNRDGRRCYPSAGSSCLRVLLPDHASLDWVLYGGSFPGNPTCKHLSIISSSSTLTALQAILTSLTADHFHQTSMPLWKQQHSHKTIQGRHVRGKRHNWPLPFNVLGIPSTKDWQLNHEAPNTIRILMLWLEIATLLFSWNRSISLRSAAGTTTATAATQLRLKIRRRDISSVSLRMMAAALWLKILNFHRPWTSNYFESTNFATYVKKYQTLAFYKTHINELRLIPESQSLSERKKGERDLNPSSFHPSSSHLQNPQAHTLKFAIILRSKGRTR